MKKIFLFIVLSISTVILSVPSYALDLNGMLNNAISELEKNTKQQSNKEPRKKNTNGAPAASQKTNAGATNHSQKSKTLTKAEFNIYCSGMVYMSTYAGDGYCRLGSDRASYAELKEYKYPSDNAELIKLAQPYYEKFKKGANKFATTKELCLSIKKETSGGINTIEWSDEIKDCEFNGWGKSHFKYYLLKDYVLAHGNEVKQARKAKLAEQKNRKQVQNAAFDAIKQSGRVYATVVMDTSEEYNAVSLAEIEKNGGSVAGLKLSLDKNRAGIIEKITLQSPTENAFSIMFGADPEETNWSMDKITKVVESIKSKYKKIDAKKDFQVHDLEAVRNAILGYHNRRKQPSQAAYNTDVNNAQAIKNFMGTLVLENKGDQIIVTVKQCLEGKGNSNVELYVNDIYQNSLTIEYISKELLKKQNKVANDKLKKESEKKKKENEEMNAL